MKTIKIDLDNVSDEDVALVVDCLKQGKVIAYPTDTIYGLGCLAINTKAVNKIYKIKKIKKPRSLLVLVKSYCMLHEYCFVSRKQEQYIRSVWPATTRLAQDIDYKYRKKPTTFVLKSRGELSKNILGEDENVAVRLPKNSFLTRILRGVNKPIISTSLNITGKNNIESLVDIKKYFKNDKPDLVINAGRLKKMLESRIIDISDINNIKIIRN